MLRFYLTFLISHHRSGEINFLLNSVCFPNTQEQRPSTTCCQCTFNPWEISCLFCKLITITTVRYPDQSLSSSPPSINFWKGSYQDDWLKMYPKWCPQLPLTGLSPFPGSLTQLGTSRGLRSQKFCIYIHKRGPFWAIFWPSKYIEQLLTSTRNHEKP